MSAIECSHEIEIVDTITSGRWPAGCTDELQLHAASCPVCRDVVRVALALTQDRSDALQAVRIPSAGLVWWRADHHPWLVEVKSRTGKLRVTQQWADLGLKVTVLRSAEDAMRWVLD